MSILIKRLESKANWMYFWGKYIKGIDLENHCSKALLGHYSRYINKEITSLENAELDDDSNIFYICGVTKPYRWADNFHLALQYKEGSNLVIDRNGVYLEIENAIELPIVFDKEKCTHHNKDKKVFNTCRNWQFAYLYQDLF